MENNRQRAERIAKKINFKSALGCAGEWCWPCNHFVAEKSLIEGVARAYEAEFAEVRRETVEEYAPLKDALVSLCQGHNGGRGDCTCAGCEAIRALLPAATKEER